MIFHGILNFPDYFCISWPVFFTIHICCNSWFRFFNAGDHVYICIYLFIYLFKVWLLYRWFLFPYVLFCVWALHPNQSSLIFGHGMSRPVRWKWQYLNILLGDTAIFDWTMIMEGRVWGYHVFFVWLSFDSSSFLRYLTSPSPFVARLSAP